MSRPIVSTYSLEIGGAHNISTYLSPLHYSGPSVALSGSWEKDFNHWSDRCRMRFEAEMKLQRTLNPAETAVMPSLTARFGWGLLWYRKLDARWEVEIGPMVDIAGGALYLMRNGNNPVTALASAGFDIEAAGSYRFRMGRVPVVVADRVRIPTASIFFSPEYGETYYEIWLGNHHGLSHAGWWGNAFGLDNLFSVSMQFGRRSLLLGYRFDFRTFNANHLTTNLLTNAAVVGLSF